MRQVRDEKLTPSDERPDHHPLYALTKAWVEIQRGEALRSTAERLLAVHPLRTADAFQMAAAVLWCQELPTEQSFVSLDHRLCDVGYREGFTVLPNTF